MPETLQDVVESIRANLSKDGSLAMHITHSWDRERGPGVWCVDCDMWVIRPPVGDDIGY